MSDAQSQTAFETWIDNLGQPASIFSKLTGRLEFEDVTVRTKNTLENTGCTFIGDVATKLKLRLEVDPAFSFKTVKEIDALLAAKDLCFGMNLPAWPSVASAAYQDFALRVQEYEMGLVTLREPKTLKSAAPVPSVEENYRAGSQDAADAMSKTAGLLPRPDFFRVLRRLIARHER